MKKLTLSLAVLLSGVVANSYAALNSKCDVKIPCYRGGFSFGLAGLYLQPSQANLDYSAFETSNGSTDERFRTVDPDFDWGFKLNLGYTLPCTGNDIKLSYTSFNSSTVDHVKSIGPWTVDDTTFNATAASAKAKFNYQAIDLDAGQHITLGRNTDVRLFGGLRYVDLESRFNLNHSAEILDEVTPGVDHVSVLTAQKSEYKGIGPRLGTEINYNLGHGFGVVGEVASALLVGNVNSDHSLIMIDTDPAGTVSVDGLSYRLPKTTRVVPNITTKLGLDYSYQLCNPSRTKFTIEAGYLTDNYFNSTDRLGILGGISPATNPRQTIDTSFSGPYVGVQVNL